MWNFKVLEIYIWYHTKLELECKRLKMWSWWLVSVEHANIYALHT